MIKGLHYVPKKTKAGVVWHVYAWRGGPSVARREGGRKPLLTAAELKLAIAAIEQANAPEQTSLNSLIREWEQSPEWKALGEGTKKTWGSQLKQITRRWGDKPLNVWNDPRMKAKVVSWRDSRAETPRGADLGVMVLRELLKFGVLRGRVLLNVAVGIPTLYRGGKRAEIVWTEEDIQRFAAEAEKQGLQHVIDGLRLCALTGLRREDLVTVTLDDVYDHAIVKRALKVSRGRRRTATMPRIPELDALLAELATRKRKDGVRTLLVNSHGKSWSGDGFGGSFNRIRDAADIAYVDPDTGERRKKHLHDVRGTFATRLILAGLANAEVADVMGWSVEQVSGIRRTYVDQSRVVVAMGERISQGGVNRTVNREEAAKN
ncbi:tyrosine-type recombinase/integrase [uncultured Erythrobacter sp.]|uniref:tyrosine-type recombinase/integrase n=1 Tax=uncultured Erythrobacter sp. TaxID=263913 RepID=UPI00265B34DF|nr:tyrosine-type recombinase/integrase [uncultured Erythrobacter sp.]